MARQPILTGSRMTYREFMRLPEQPGLQLIDGFIVKEPSATYGHQSSAGLLFAHMWMFVQAHDLGRVIVAPFDVILGEQVLQPDIMFVRSDRVELIHDNGLYGAPDLAVEVLSPSTRRYDLGRKRELYFQHGCREIWFVDVETREMQRVILQGEIEMLLTESVALETDLLPGFSLPLDELFAT